MGLLGTAGTLRQILRSTISPTLLHGQSTPPKPACPLLLLFPLLLLPPPCPLCTPTRDSRGSPVLPVSSSLICATLQMEIPTRPHFTLLVMERVPPSSSPKRWQGSLWRVCRPVLERFESSPMDLERLGVSHVVPIDTDGVQAYSEIRKNAVRTEAALQRSSRLRRGYDMILYSTNGDSLMGNSYQCRVGASQEGACRQDLTGTADREFQVERLEVYIVPPPSPPPPPPPLFVRQPCAGIGSGAYITKSRMIECLSTLGVANIPSAFDFFFDTTATAELDLACNAFGYGTYKRAWGATCAAGQSVSVYPKGCCTEGEIDWTYPSSSACINMQYKNEIECQAYSPSPPPSSPMCPCGAERGDLTSPSATAARPTSEASTAPPTLLCLLVTYR